MTQLLLGVGGSVLVGAVCTALFTPVIRHAAWRWGMLDVPKEERKLHTRTTPTGGGLAIAGGVGVGALVLYSMQGVVPAVNGPLFWSGAFLMLGAGYWDDVYGLNPKGKFLLQVSAAYLLLHAGFHLNVAGLPFVENDAYQQALYSIPLSMLWVVGIINAVNLIDGLDGLAAGVMGIAFLACATIFGLKGHPGLLAFGVMVAGAIGGFLLYNFKPASIFMGDAGSLFLGYLLAAYTLQTPLHADPMLALLIPAVLLGIPVLDTGLAIARRLYQGRAVFYPDTNHIHHRLVERGSEKSAVLILYGVAGWFGTAAILMALLPAGWGYAVGGGTGIVALGWVWRLGYLRPGEWEQHPEEEEVPATRLLGQGDGAPRSASPTEESLDENTSTWVVDK